MGRKYVLTDDLDGKELPDDTKPINLGLGRTRYNLYLSEKNHGKLLEALNPFIENAETAYEHKAPSKETATADREKLKKVRAWAQSTGFTYKNAKGEDTTLGDRGRIPHEVVEAYDKAN